MHGQDFDKFACATLILHNTQFNASLLHVNTLVLPKKTQRKVNEKVYRRDRLLKCYSTSRQLVQKREIVQSNIDKSNSFQ